MIESISEDVLHSFQSRMIQHILFCHDDVPFSFIEEEDIAKQAGFFLPFNVVVYPFISLVACLLYQVMIPRFGAAWSIPVPVPVA